MQGECSWILVIHTQIIDSDNTLFLAHILNNFLVAPTWGLSYCHYTHTYVLIHVYNLTGEAVK